MAGYVMNMSILVSNINHRGQKDLSFKVRHKAYASRWQQGENPRTFKHIWFFANARCQNKKTKRV